MVGVVVVEAAAAVLAEIVFKKQKPASSAGLNYSEINS